ncbi:MAG TPA: type II/IV secretion system protein, partial [Campylobacterales bacterium]|nr:type II/IV secretion system protein [Campylobacterales bacterium]
VIADPFEYESIDHIQSKISSKLKISIASEHTIKKTLKKFKASISGDYKATISTQYHNFTKKDLHKFDNENSELPIIEFVQFVVLEAKKVRASDIHIEPTEDELIVRYRVDGVLQTEVTLPLKVHREVVSRIKIISDMNVAEKRLPQDGRFDIVDEEGKKMDMRVSTFPTVYGEKVVMRLLEQDSLKPSLEDLNLDSEDLELLQNKINSPYGLILITGPTGSGKTTTLYSALSTIDKDTKNVLTVEDPVEYRLDGVYQMQTNEKIGLTFANGLRTILRQDPDIIMVGEIRDLDTANMAIRASLTGHIVFSTLHTNDSIGVIIRLINMGIEPFLVSSAVSLTVAQRLVRNICPDCIDYRTSTELLEHLEENGVTKSKLESLNIELDEDFDYAYGKGCSSCRGTGYRGRQAVFEFFEPTLEIKQEILKSDFDESRIREIAKRDGMQTLLDHGLELVEQGVTTIDEIIRVIGD